ncbi:xanthine dehydrogenase family protein molybdopterin-binding subunit [Pseudoroseomonas wenyumeiae]|uniref:Xanthine dehydrogenase family protein molybdopterin-binding subunit n=1 Tax=Teichococcus wenyumeiae TaxID=2478470 RepID=A0A3A9JES7_9PROT|nr:xanthine dehydrogenase family protein molybdopterin-binding subunit [Pseudoroseomonas wenyumeiae]RKK03183.1 xanthine dehydrogenase family protein molybdopterin-binding subunit [Pseudoroseomonas wenyumeiae]RMI26111.1 xanthine dehydrogenase family protein molybdopterin-binding subunit [Pseudoroseomonas wenyumeiae]
MPDSLLPDPSRLKFGIGQPVPRNEDPVLLQGRGRYTDDLQLPGQLWCVIVRSPYAHGILKGIDTAAAKEVPGVVGVFTAADMAEYGTLHCMMPSPGLQDIQRPVLASDKVRFVGDPIAFVVAETKEAAKDGAEAVFPDIDPLPVVTEASAAAAPGAPQLYDDVPGNLVQDFHSGDATKVAEAFAGAAHVTRLNLRNNRIVVSAMEPRSAVGEYDAASGRYTLHVGSQGVFGMRNAIAKELLKVPNDKLRVLTGNVGGSFGMKAGAYPEYICLLHAAKVLGRPVKWTDERTGSFLSDYHGRDHEVTAELALDAEGKFLAVRLTSFANMGAYLSNVGPLMGTAGFGRNVQSNYTTPLIEVSTKSLVTNTPPVTAYRGAGRPEGNYFMERLIEAAAQEMGISAIEMRRRNHIKPDQFPYAAASGSKYDGGEFNAVLDKALAAADWDGFEARKAESKARGRLRGRGIGNFLEATAPPSKEMGGLRFGEDGSVTIITGTLDYGQGHWTPFAQVLHQTLGIPFDRIKLVQGDSDKLIAGGGTGGSKSLMASGAAIVEASAKVVDKARIAAAHMLEAAEADIEFDPHAEGGGRFSIAGTDRGLDIMTIAARLREAKDLPPEVPDTLDVDHVFDQAPSAFPNGCHVVELEVDPETGVVHFDRYVTVNDFGVIVNPLMVEGQAHGGIVQGIGQALMERTNYSEDGQFLSGSYSDYAVPRAVDVPSFEFISHAVPAKTNPLGVKGCGEAGCAGSLPAVMNALVDALSEYGVKHIDMPATPEVVWRAIHQQAA